MAEARALRQPLLVSTEVLTDEQCQRILALRAAREVVETRTQAGPMTVAGTDFKDYLLLITAQWIMEGRVGPIPQIPEIPMTQDEALATVRAAADG